MNRSRLPFGVIAACLAALLAHSPRVSVAQTTDKTVTELTNASVSYESAMEAIRGDIRSQLRAKADQAKKMKGDNTEAVNRVNQETKEFEFSGSIPESAKHDKTEQDYAKAAAAMKKAYNRAKLSQGGDQMFGPELDLFWSHWDLVPWQDKLARTKPEPDRTIAVGGTPLNVETGLQGEYRLEIKAKRGGDAGALFVSFPLTDGKRLELPVVIGDKGDIRVLVTVRKGQVIGNLGVTRPIDMSNAVSGDASAIVLRADGGAFTVDSVRVKPVVEGKPPEVQEQAKKSSEKGRDNEDPLPLGLTGEGDCFHHATADSTMRATVKVDRRDGNVVELSIVLAGTGESFLVRCILNGSNLSVTNAQQTRAPAGHAPFVTTKTEGGTGSIRNGVLNLNWSVRGNSPKIGNNREWMVRLQDVKMK